MVGVTGSIPVAPTTPAPRPARKSGLRGQTTIAHTDARLQDRPGCYTVRQPTFTPVPLVFSSPHSGRDYAQDFVASARLDAVALRTSEDCYIDEIFSHVPEHGAVLLAASFPRVWCDANREAWELDPAMFEDRLPPWVNTASVRVSAGLGTIARVVSTGEAIYHGRLRFAEAERRVANGWRPYHDALAGLLEAARARFGACLLVDCHSMPAHACADRKPVPDIVLGDVFGASCAPAVMITVERFLIGRGYVVRRNDPYAGGYVTRHYGRPGQGVHALQLELARGLYMNESTLEKGPGFRQVAADMGELAGHLAERAPELLRPAG